MASNTFINLPVPSGNGVGASIDVSSLNANKSIFVGGLAANDPQIVIVEGASAAAPSDSDFAPISTIQQPSNFDDPKVVIRFARVRIRNFLINTSQLATVNIGGLDAINAFVTVPTPVGNGVGAAVDVSAFGSTKSVFIGGLSANDPQIVIVEGADATTPADSDFAPIATIELPNNFKNIELTTRFVRLRIRNFLVGTSQPATVNLGAEEPTTPADSGGGTILVFQPGGTADPDAGVFITEATLYAALNALGEVPRAIEFRDNFVSPIVLLTGNDMSKTRWMGAQGDGNSFGPSAAVHIGDGSADVLFPNLLTYGQNISVLNNNPTTSPVSLKITDLIQLFGNTDLSSAVGAAPFYESSGVPGGNLILTFLNNVSTFSLMANGIVIDIGAGIVLINVIGEGSSIGQNCLSSAADSARVDQIAASSGRIEDQAGWLGAVTRVVNATPMYQYNPPSPTVATANVGNATYNNIIQCDVSGGVFTQTLIDIQASAFKGEGRRVAVCEISGTAGLLVAPGGTDTINGSTSSVSVPAGGCLVFVSDGISNWNIISIFRPAEFNPSAAIITAPTTLTIRDMARVNPTAGPITLTLPIILGTSPRIARGEMIIVKNITVSVNAITIAAGIGNTIDGFASTTIAVGLGSLTFMVDSTLNWSII